jgi:hypothetical protein
MPIIDNEIIGEGSSGEFKIPNVPLGIFIETSIRKIADKHSNAKWLVSFTFVLSLFNHRPKLE